MKKFKKLVSIGLLILLFTGSTIAQLVVEKFDKGWINYEAGVIKATGYGAPKPNVPAAQAKLTARRAAIGDCYRNLAEIVNGVRVTSETVTENFIVKSDVIKTEVNGLIKGAQIISEKQLPDGSYEVIMQIEMFGKEDSLSKVIIDEAIEAEKEEYKDKYKKEIAVLPPIPEVWEEKEAEYTGLIIDARGLGVKPAMSPKIINEFGDIIYGAVKVAPEIVIEKGIVGYATTLEKAKTSWRVGSNPLIIKAKDKYGPLAADIIISNEDANRILQLNNKSYFLQNLHVIIVI